MSFHKSNLGLFGDNIQADVNGYVPTAETTAWELTYDHGIERTHTDDGELTEYGHWWEDERFPEIQAEAIEAAEKAEAGIAAWRRD